MLNIHAWDHGYEQAGGNIKEMVRLTLDDHLYIEAEMASLTARARDALDLARGYRLPPPPEHARDLLYALADYAVLASAIDLAAGTTTAMEEWCDRLWPTVLDTITILYEVYFGMLDGYVAEFGFFETMLDLVNSMRPQLRLGMRAMLSRLYRDMSFPSVGMMDAMCNLVIYDITNASWDPFDNEEVLDTQEYLLCMRDDIVTVLTEAKYTHCQVV